MVPPIAAAQAGVPQIGWLSSGSPLSAEQRRRSPFFQGLRKLGWAEGKNIAIEQPYAAGKVDQLPVLAAELVQLKVNVIGEGDSGAIPAAYHATSTIPIVMTVSGDPLRAGYIAHLAQPGGNITGLTLMVPELAGKRLELLTVAVPGVASIAQFSARRPSTNGQP
jgi:putative tryptophan/tyrosine transport system substrate-binding protein